MQSRWKVRYWSSFLFPFLLVTAMLLYSFECRSSLLLVNTLPKNLGWLVIVRQAFILPLATDFSFFNYNTKKKKGKLGSSYNQIAVENTIPRHKAERWTRNKASNTAQQSFFHFHSIFLVIMLYVFLALTFFSCSLLKNVTTRSYSITNVRLDLRVLHFLILLPTSFKLAYTEYKKKNTNWV